MWESERKETATGFLNVWLLLLMCFHLYNEKKTNVINTKFMQDHMKLREATKLVCLAASRLM